MSLSQSNEIAAPVADDVKTGHAEAHAGPHAGAHAVPKRILIAVYVLLLIFTAITVGVSTLNLGIFNIWVALLVAVIKGALVALFFMHLFWDSPFNGLILVAALFFVALFIGIAMLDAHSYEVNMQPPLTVIMPQSVETVTPGGTTATGDTGPKIATMKPAQVLDQVAATHGDVLEGEQLFTKQGCVACHTVRKVEPLKGPCLADVAKKYNRRDLAEQIINPNLKIADGFITYHYKMDSGDVIEGFMVKETPDKIILRNIQGQYITIDPSEVVSHKKLTTSPMPEGIVGTLTVKQFASLVDYLQALAGVK